MNCWICGKPKGQPPERCPGHYEIPEWRDLTNEQLFRALIPEYEPEDDPK